MKVLLTLTILSYAGFLGVDALKCYSCLGTGECSNAKKIDCTQASANQTREYLNYHYKGVDMSTNSNSFMCIRDTLSDSTGDHAKSGCMYAETNPCALDTSEAHPGFSYKRCCSRCNTDYCNNPAGRAALSIAAMLGSFFAVGWLRRFMMGN